MKITKSKNFSGQMKGFKVSYTDAMSAKAEKKYKARKDRERKLHESLRHTNIRENVVIGDKVYKKVYPKSPPIKDNR